MRLVGTNAFTVAILASALVVGGCATKRSGPDPLVQCLAKSQQCEQERQQCASKVTELSEKLGDQVRKRQLSERKLADVEKERDAADQALANCRKQSTQVNQQVKSLESAKTELEKRLTKSIAQRDVQIELLNNKLSVRVLNRILFESGSARIERKGLNVLGEVATVLAGGNELIRVEGHTDNVPISATLTYRYATNWELSAARAISVVRFFENEHQIEPVRMEAVGHSYHQPVTSNDTPAERQFNRRVEVVLTAPER